MEAMRWVKIFYIILILVGLVLGPVSRSCAETITKAYYHGEIAWRFDPFQGNIAPAPMYLDNLGNLDFFGQVYWTIASGPLEAHCTANVNLYSGKKPTVNVSGSTNYVLYRLSANSWIEYHIRVDKKDPWAPNHELVPLKITATGYATVDAMGYDYYNAGGTIHAGGSVFFGTPSNPYQDAIINGSGNLGWHLTYPTHWQDSRTITENVPVGEIFAVTVSGSGYVEGGSQPGKFNVHVDPVIEIDPDWMVQYYDGRMVPGTQLYSLTFSPGFNPVPLPGVLMLLLD
jgi:hypothetical protein